MRVAYLITVKDSERLPNKNLLKIGDKTLIEIAVDKCRKYAPKSDIFISPGSKKLSDYCRKLGVKVLPIRGPELTGPNVFLLDVVKHCCKQLTISYSHIIMVSVCHPLASHRHIKTIKEHLEYGMLSSFTAMEFNYPFIEDKPSCSHNRKNRILRWSYLRGWDIKNLLFNSKKIKGYGETDVHSIVGVNEFDIDINTKRDYLIAKELYKIRGKLK